MRILFLTGIIISCLIGFCIGILFKILNQPQFLNPQGQPGQVLSASDKKTEYISMGFLPYWLINNTEYLDTQYLTHLAYFGVEISEQGQILIDMPDNTKEIGLHRLNTSPQLQNIFTQAKTTNTDLILVVRAMSNDRITAALKTQNQQPLIEELIELVRINDFQGLNIDFEPNAEISPEIRQQYVLFLSQLTTQCKATLSQCHISIDTYASAASNPRLWDLKSIANIVDHIVVMGYDFHPSASPAAGPNAPLHGAPLRWKYDLVSTIQNFYQHVPPEKIILAVPYYGYQWDTITNQPGSLTLGRGSSVPYEEAQQLALECQPPECHKRFDTDSLSPYLTRQNDNDTWTQIWYDDPISLKLKYQLIKESQLAGTAYWALGYEGPNSPLWTAFTQELLQ